MKGQIQRWRDAISKTLIRVAYGGKIATDPSCCCECFVFEDAFDRSNSTYVGSNWNEVVGDWGIQAITDDMLTTHQRLVEKYDTAMGTAGALIICTQPVPNRSAGEMIVSIEVPFYGLTIGDIYHIYPACVDENTVGPVRMTYVWDGINWTSYIYYNDVEQDFYKMPAIGTPHEFILNACVDRELGGAKAWVAPTVNQYAAWAVPLDPGTGQYAGIGHNNPGHLNQFDNFHLEELRTEEVLCEPCFCECEGTTPSLHLKAAIACATGRAECFGGQVFDLDFYRTSRPQVLTWRGGLTFMGEVLEWELRCTATNVATGFNMVWVQCGQPGHNCSTLTDTCVAPTICACLPGPAGLGWMALASSVCGVSSCDPLQLVFGPFTLSFPFTCDICYSKNMPGSCIFPGGDRTLCDGDFYIIVTEDLALDADFEDATDWYWEDGQDRFWES